MNQKSLDTHELSGKMMTGDVSKLILHMNIPAGIYDQDCDGLTFLSTIVNWEGFNPYSFYQALTSLNRPELLAIAMKIPNLCVSEPTQETDLFAEPLSMKTLLQLLRTEISQKEWHVIAISVKDSLQGKDDFENIFKELLERDLIRSDLKKLQEISVTINRSDLANKIREYQPLFVELSEEEFIGRMKEELALQSAEIKQWQDKLKQFINMKNTMVTQLLGDDDVVSLSSVYIDLTIVKEKPRPVKLEDETTYNEIAYLRKIAKKEIEITPVDFTEELKSCKTEEPEVWCLIGNPGCGKTFLSKRIALRFSQYELRQISYSIAIPCRNTDWHSMECTRVEEDKAVTTEFVQEWLCLGLPVTSDWPKDLAKHLVKSDGEGLLLIIDGLDEFTKKIPFEKSLLYLLLTRQILHRSTIIVTTRPGAWTDISSQHELLVNRFYQVLGFSPENRDMYFQKQIVKLDKLKVCRNLLTLYDEMNQLSLIPVNASLFAALLKEESVLINTLTQLYRELTCYLIRRQLSRMGLKELSKVIKLELFDKCVLDCLYTIGRIALMGVTSRELTSTERVTMTINHIEIECHCLGLAHEFHTKESRGSVKKVWAFAHLTMQEFISAIFLKSTSWTDQCMSIRYMADSNEHFSLYRMVVRFLCGLLHDNSAVLLTILYRKLLPETIDNLPMYHQMGFESLRLQRYTGWYCFTHMYFRLNSILFETDSLRVYHSLKHFLPTSISLYLNQRVLPVSPNESKCFIQSLPLVQHIKLLYIDTSHVSIKQLASLLKEVQNYPLYQLVVKFEQAFKQKKPMSPKILTYTDLINKTKFNDNTRISIELTSCEVEDLKGIDLFSSDANHHINSVRLYNSNCSTEILHQLAKNVISSKYFEYIYLEETKSENLEILIPALYRASNLKGLYLNYFLKEDNEQLLLELVLQLTRLTEINYLHYSLLPHIANLTGFTYLQMAFGYEESLSSKLLQVLNTNHSTLRVVKLCYLDNIGFQRWTEFLSAIQCCVNLIKLELRCISISSEDTSQWTDTLRCLQSLIYLSFHYVTLSDAGLLAVCQGLAKHRSIKVFDAYECEQTSQSCEPLTNLIPTTRQLERLRVNKLSQPDPVPIEALKLVAEEYSIGANLIS